MAEHREYLLVEVSRRGRDGDYAGASEVASLQARATALEANPVITSLEAVPDVSLTGLASGEVLMRDSGQWVNAPMPSGTVKYIETGSPLVEVMQDAARLDFRYGLVAAQSGVV